MYTINCRKETRSLSDGLTASFGSVCDIQKGTRPLSHELTASFGSE